MSAEPFFAEAASLMGDPARANILSTLMDGRAWTAKELAFAAGVSPQTTSGHLAKLVAGGLIEGAVQGRHRYYRLAGAAVAQAIEALSVLSVAATPRHRPKTRASAEMAAARTCYDHLAGRLGVAIHDALVGQGALVIGDSGYALSKTGTALFAEIGIGADALGGKRALARPCLDWSERRSHLAGSLAAALACRCFELGWVERRKETRAVRLTPPGLRELTRRLGPLTCEAVTVEAA